MKSLPINLSFLKKKRAWIVFPLFLAAAFIVFANSLHSGFIFDDNPLIAENHIIKNLSFIPVIFARPFMDGYYRPLVSVSFSLDYFFGGLDPLVFHSTNVFLHAACAFMFFVLFSLLFAEVRIAFSAAFLFLVHPLVNVNVNYISDRGNILAALFMLCALVSFVQAYKTRKMWLNFPAAIFCLLALFSRENALLLPLYLALCLFAVWRRSETRNAAVLISVSGLMSGGYYVWRAFSFKLPHLLFAAAGDYFDPANIASFGKVVFKYFSLFLFPGPVCFFRRIEPSGYWGEILIFILAMLGILLLWIRAARANKELLFCGLWFLTGILPLYPLLFSRPQIGLIMQDSWIYFSLPALTFSLCLGLAYLCRGRKEHLFYFSATVIFVYFSFQTIILNRYWRDAETYCAYWQNIVPGNVIASWEMAKVYRDRGDYDKAVGAYQQAISENRVERDGKFFISRKSSDLYAQLADVYNSKKDTGEAIKNYYIALKINPYNFYAHYKLAGIFMRKREFSKAETHYRMAVRMDPLFIPARYKLAAVLRAQGREKEAAEELHQAYLIDPELRY